ncbi:MAG: HPF/RaiA family ribosome-associated protein [Anaerolineae bacterium]|nr:HPF/RaiA family ribosome-associated protein [Anaerolineae bacterium]
MLGRSNYHFEFHSEAPYLNFELIAEADNRLSALVASHPDLSGATVDVEAVSLDENAGGYRTRVVVYSGSENIIAEEKGESLEDSLRAAIDAIERQVWKRHEKPDQLQQAEQIIQERQVYQLSAREIFDIYVDQLSPAALLNQDRLALAAELMSSKGMDQEVADYTAGQIIAFAQEISQAPHKTDLR